MTPVIDLIGSEGFIGKAIQREASSLTLRCWSHTHTESSQYFDLLETASWDCLLASKPHTVILLSWPGLPNYQALFHVSRNLPASIELISRLIDCGVKRLVVAGTCYEYGLQNGELHEDQLTDPVNLYAIAKDTLRRVVADQCNRNKVQWSWIRIFYPYGEGQNPNSLLPSLKRAILQGESSFPMGSGRQIRDFIPVADVAKQFLAIAWHPAATGMYNCGTGVPRSIREIAESEVIGSGQSLNLELGVFPDREDEPLAFWASTRKINNLLA